MKLFILTLGILIAGSAAAQTGSNTVQWLKHTDTAYHLSIEYPSDWQLKPPSENARFFITSYPESDKDYFRENLNCLVPNEAEKNIPIKAVEKQIIATLSESLTDFKMIQSGYSKWNNVSALEIEYTCTKKSDGVNYYLHMLQKIAIIKGKLYGLTYTSLSDSYEKYIGTIRRMIESFKVM